MTHHGPALSRTQIDHFIQKGFVRIDEAFSETLAAECRALLWRATGCDPQDRATWTRPVVRIGHIPHPRFVEAANTARLHAAFDALVGPERWLPCPSMGTFPIRFPSEEDPGDCGWHIDASFGWENEPDFLKWRINAYSKGRALLMLFLFSDVDEHNAPTRLRVGSHLEMAARLAPHGERGLTLGELAAQGFGKDDGAVETLATGPAGTVYLCHPFLVHSAQPHRGTEARFMAQPPLLPRVPLDPERPEDQRSPVEEAMARGIAGSGVSS
ncbi:phytanoyl-CoA dioxygenase family protein [Lujinxingia vulgaris]|uniref:Phytanoyl-CoA dioxygenase family protein n=1 Tax=Lujinxingia vulgaris TaxID=2600176 RepID=A0A5C6X3Y0_9DELT|nr:phytanoyl-CoA dioxygenase family protein [Lujinxingia vulgaris]TXD32725.1 phytanoyl-CoA dioxygenase family protein [Lujinxingia vulgaris]